MWAVATVCGLTWGWGITDIRKKAQPRRAPESGGLARQQRRDLPRRPARLRHPWLRRDLGPRAEPAARGEPQPPQPAVRIQRTALAGDRRRSEERRVGKEWRSRLSPYH